MVQSISWKQVKYVLSVSISELPFFQWRSLKKRRRRIVPRKLRNLNLITPRLVYIKLLAILYLEGQYDHIFLEESFELRRSALEFWTEHAPILNRVSEILLIDHAYEQQGIAVCAWWK